MTLVQPLHLLVSIFMKTRSMVGSPYADLDEKVLMQASLQRTFSFKPAHGWTVTKFWKKHKKSVDIFWQAWYYNWAADEEQENKKKQEKINKKLLTKRFLSCKIEKHVWRDIEAVITRRSWKPFVRKGAWVRIPLSPLRQAQWDAFKNKYSLWINQAEVPKWLKGLPWKGSRSLVAARGFKSLLLRCETQVLAYL